MDAERQQIERILHSKAFRGSEVQRSLLAYLAEKSLAGEADSLKEYTVGLEALGKPPSYDPRQDSVVRVHVARLRAKLEEYYRTDGVTDPVVVDLPKGGFRVVFVTRPTTAEAQKRPAPAVGDRGWRWREIGLAVALVAVTTFAVYLALEPPRAVRETTQAAWTPELQQIWGPLLASDRPLVVCIAARLMVRIPGVGFVRDPDLDEWNELTKAKGIRTLKQKLRPSSLFPSYGFTGIGTASGAFLLGKFLGPRRQNVVMVRSDLLSWPELKENNVVFLGSPAGTRQMESLPMNQQIVMESDGIRNLNPQPGEPAFIPDQVSGAHVGEDSHALITDMPGLYGRGEVLILSGNQLTSVIAGVEAVTDPNLARMLVKQLRGPSGRLPRYYQVVLSVHSKDNFPVEISYMFHHELGAAKRLSAGAR